jgi:glucose/mannose-6-phosphate isomerase
MNLNDTARFKKLDPEDMIARINGLPDQLLAAWELGLSLDLPAWKGIRQIVVAGMGGSAIGADLLNAYAQPLLKTSLHVQRGYGLPAWANGEETLVICSSHSGSTEETLSAFEAAQKNNCRILCISTGGQLAEQTKSADAALWTFDHKGQPRTAVGYSFALLLAAVFRLNLIPDPSTDLEDAIAAMREQQKSCLPEVPDTANSSKRMAGQFMERWITIWGAGLMAPVARRWKTQINENSKAQASFEILPEAGHNTIQGAVEPEKSFTSTMTLFLRSTFNHPRDEIRAEHARMAVMVEGQNTDTITALGNSPLAHIWTALHYGDYVSYYLAMAYGLDPTPVPMLVDLKEKMNKSK